MDKLKMILKDNTFIRHTFFIVFNAILLYILYFLIKNIGSITGGLHHGFLVLMDAFKPLLIGLVLAYLLNPLVSFVDSKLLKLLVRLPDDPIKLEKKRNTRYLISVLISYLFVIAAILAILYGFAVMLIGRISFTNAPHMLQDLMGTAIKYEATLQTWIQHNIPHDILSDKVTEFTNYLMSWISENMSATTAIAFVTSLGGNIVDFVIGIIISIYLMKDKKFFLGLWRKFLHLLLPQKANAVFTETLHDINVVLSRFIRGALLDSLFVAILSSIGLSIMGLEAAVFIGVFAGLANVIPYFGPVLGMIPAFLMGLCTGGFWHGALAVVILLVVQQIDSNFIYPKVVGSSTGLKPLVVLLAVSVFGYFGGIVGMLLAVPLAGIIQIFVLKWVRRREAKLIQKRRSGKGKIPPIMD